MPTDGLRLLVVDDNRDAADSFALLLNMWGHVANTVYNGEDAIQKARSEPPDVVFLDLKMPGFDGFRLLNALRQMHELSASLFVAITGSTSDRNKAMSVGFHHFFVKPVDEHELQTWLDITPRRR